MARWMRPSEEMPDDYEVGDRFLLIVRERPTIGAAIVRRLVIIEATEDGFTSPDDTYDGYSPADAEFWSPEKSVCAFAEDAS